jgi:hypothetical protein
MKINVTFDVSDEALIGINLMLEGPIAPAKRDDARQFIVDIVEAQLGSLEAGFDRFRQKFRENLTDLDSYIERRTKEANEV